MSGEPKIFSADIIYLYMPAENVLTDDNIDLQKHILPSFLDFRYLIIMAIDGLILLDNTGRVPSWKDLEIEF